MLSKLEQAWSGTLSGTLYGIQILAQAYILCSLAFYRSQESFYPVRYHRQAHFHLYQKPVMENQRDKGLQNCSDEWACADLWWLWMCIIHSPANTFASIRAPVIYLKKCWQDKKKALLRWKQMIYKEVLGLFLLCTIILFWKHSENVYKPSTCKKKLFPMESLFFYLSALWKFQEKFLLNHLSTILFLYKWDYLSDQRA